MRESSPKDASGRLRLARKKAGFKSSRFAALRFGWKPSTYASHENGQTPVPLLAASKYAKAFNTSYFWLLTGENPGVDFVKIDGAVLKLGEIELFPAGKNAPRVWLPFGIVADTLVLQVRDRGMSPRYDFGDLIIVDSGDPDLGAETIPEMVGKEAIIQTESGLHLGRLRQAKRPGLYDLEGINCPPIRDVTVTRAHRLLAIVRASSVTDFSQNKSFSKLRAATAASRARK